MARALTRFDKSDSIFWVHDYHFLPLGAEMRRLGIERPIGFLSAHAVADRLTCRSATSSDTYGCWPTISWLPDDRIPELRDYLRHELANLRMTYRTNVAGRS